MRRALTSAGLAVIATAVAPAPADGDGLPIGAIGARSGVTVPASGARYDALAIGRRTLAVRVSRSGGDVLQSRVLPRRFVVPAVALDGTPAGLSADGRTLALIHPHVPSRHSRTRIAVLGAHRLALRRIVELDGYFSFDALSPDGATMYLIQYPRYRDPTRYRVRAYDVGAGRLERGAIVDPREPDEQMRGFPATRTASPDGRWAYTLYDGGGGEPFIHALDTRDGSAACIDLGAFVEPQDAFASRLSVSGDALTVRGPGGPVAVVDRSTFAVREPAPRPAAARPRAGDGGGGIALLPIAGAGAALLLVFGAGAAARRRGATSARPA